MHYLYSRYEYEERTVIDVYVDFDGKEIPECIDVSAKHLLNPDNFIKQVAMKLPIAERLPFTGGNLVFVKRAKDAPRRAAFTGALFYDNN